MYQYQFEGGFVKVDHDYFFESRYVCFTFFNFEFDKDPLSTSIEFGILGLHLAIVWTHLKIEIK
jgi:hypothetical protein